MPSACNRKVAEAAESLLTEGLCVRRRVSKNPPGKKKKKKKQHKCKWCVKKRRVVMTRTKARTASRARVIGECRSRAEISLLSTTARLYRLYYTAVPGIRRYRHIVYRGRICRTLGTRPLPQPEIWHFWLIDIGRTGQTHGGFTIDVCNLKICRKFVRIIDTT